MATLHLLFPSTQENAIPASFCFEQHPSMVASVEDCDCRKCLIHYKTYHEELANEAHRRLSALAGRVG